MKKLTKNQRMSMRAVKDGADVFGYGIARDLRDIQREHPGLVTITTAKGRDDPVGQLPYFGAILTTAGRKAIIGG